MYEIAVLQSNSEQACLCSLQLRVVYAATPRVRLRPGVQEEEVLFRLLTPQFQLNSAE